MLVYLYMAHVCFTVVCNAGLVAYVCYSFTVVQHLSELQDSTYLFVDKLFVAFLLK